MDPLNAIGSPTITPDPIPTDSTEVVATGVARQTDATAGDCLGFSINVTGVPHGVALQPITEFLTGPYADPPEPGDAAATDVVGQISAVWDGNEWSYSGDCVTVDDVGSYVWVIQNPGDHQNGSDWTVHPDSIVRVTAAVTAVTNDPTVAPVGSSSDTSAETITGGQVPTKSASTLATATLAETGVNGTNLASIAGFALGAASVGGLALLIHRRARPKQNPSFRKESGK